MVVKSKPFYSLSLTLNSTKKERFTWKSIKSCLLVSRFVLDWKISYQKTVPIIFIAKTESFYTKKRVKIQIWPETHWINYTKYCRAILQSSFKTVNTKLYNNVGYINYLCSLRPFYLHRTAKFHSMIHRSIVTSLKDSSHHIRNRIFPFPRAPTRTSYMGHSYSLSHVGNTHGNSQTVYRIGWG